MNLVVDANSAISALIKSGKSAEILLNFVFDFFTPEFAFEEIEKYKEEILIKTHRSKEEFHNILSGLREIINVMPKEYYEEYLEEAKQNCPDEKDTEYFALALKLKCGIWSNDGDLKKQNKVKIYSTEDLVNYFGL